jgi:hypothetical protein
MNEALAIDTWVLTGIGSVYALLSCADLCRAPPSRRPGGRSLPCTRAVFAGLEARLQSDSGMPLAYYSILVTLAEAPDRAWARCRSARASLRSADPRTDHAASRDQRNRHGGTGGSLGSGWPCCGLWKRGMRP